MLKRRRARRGAAAMTVTVPAPVGGLNTRDSLNLMPATDAVRLDNWNPGISALSVREGYRPVASGSPPARSGPWPRSRPEPCTR